MGDVGRDVGNDWPGTAYGRAILDQGGEKLAVVCKAIDFDAAACYYGTGIVDLKDETPKCPTILHFGKDDQTISMDDVDAISAAHPDVPVYIYDAGHGFNCDRRGSYHEESSRIALKRTLEFFAENVG